MLNMFVNKADCIPILENDLNCENWLKTTKRGHMK